MPTSPIAGRPCRLCAKPLPPDNAFEPCNTCFQRLFYSLARSTASPAPDDAASPSSGWEPPLTNTARAAIVQDHVYACAGAAAEAAVDDAVGRILDYADFLGLFVGPPRRLLLAPLAHTPLPARVARLLADWELPPALPPRAAWDASAPFRTRGPHDAVVALRPPQRAPSGLATAFSGPAPRGNTAAAAAGGGRTAQGGRVGAPPPPRRLGTPVEDTVVGIAVADEDGGGGYETSEHGTLVAGGAR